jgi:hypothetical protein
VDDASVRFQDGKPVEASGKVDACGVVVAKALGIDLGPAIALVLPLLPESVVLAWRKKVTPEVAATVGYGKTPATLPSAAQINPPDGTPASAVGELEKKGKKGDAQRAKLLDGRIVADLKKDELSPVAIEYMAKIGRDPTLEGEYLSRCTLAGAAWYNRGPKIPKADELCRDVSLMVALFQGEPLDQWPTRGAAVVPEPLAENVATVEGTPESEPEVVPADDPLAEQVHAHPEVAASVEALDVACKACAVAQGAVDAKLVEIKDAELTGRADDAEDARAELVPLETKLKRAQKAESAAFDAAHSIAQKVRAEMAAASVAAPDPVQETPEAQTPAPDVAPDSADLDVPDMVQGQRCDDGPSEPKLYIGCAPCGVAVDFLEEWIEPYLQAAAKAGAVQHHLLLKGYQEGGKRVAAYLVVQHKAHKLILPRHLVCDRRNSTTDAVLEDLIRMYGRQNVIERLG